MSTFKVQATVTLRRSVLDPQGKAVEHSLHALGYKSAQGVRIGKLIELEVESPTRAQALSQAEEMCRKLLSNPVMEDFRCEVVGESA